MYLEAPLHALSSPCVGPQARQGDGIRKKMRKIIGRSVLIIATPVEKQAPNWHKAIWCVFTVTCDSTRYRFCLTEAAAAVQAELRIASAFFQSVVMTRGFPAVCWTRRYSNEPLKKEKRTKITAFLGGNPRREVFF